MKNSAAMGHERRSSAMANLQSQAPTSMNDTMSCFLYVQELRFSLLVVGHGSDPCVALQALIWDADHVAFAHPELRGHELFSSGLSKMASSESFFDSVCRAEGDLGGRGGAAVSIGEDDGLEEGEVEYDDDDDEVDDLGALWIPFTSTRELRAPAIVPNGFFVLGRRGVGKSTRITLSTDAERRLQLVLVGKTRSTGTSSPSRFLTLSILLLRDVLFKASQLIFHSPTFSSPTS